MLAFEEWYKTAKPSLDKEIEWVLKNITMVDPQNWKAKFPRIMYRAYLEGMTYP